MTDDSEATAEQTTDGQTRTDRSDAPNEADLEHHWTVVLAEFWRQTDWDDLGGGNWTETFEERLVKARRATDVHGAFDALSRGLNLAGVSLPTAHTDPLVANSERAMEVLRREHVFLVNKAHETVDAYYDDSENRDDDAAPTGPTHSPLSNYVSLPEADA